MVIEDVLWKKQSKRKRRGVVMGGKVRAVSHKQGRFAGPLSPAREERGEEERDPGGDPSEHPGEDLGGNRGDPGGNPREGPSSQ